MLIADNLVSYHALKKRRIKRVLNVPTCFCSLRAQNYCQCFSGPLTTRWILRQLVNREVRTLYILSRTDIDLVGRKMVGQDSLFSGKI